MRVRVCNEWVMIQGWGAGLGAGVACRGAGRETDVSRNATL